MPRPFVVAVFRSAIPFSRACAATRPGVRPFAVLAALVLALAAGPAAARGELFAPVFEGLGDYHMPITTDAPRAQQFFDQGMVLAFGFNHREAARSFRQAQALDPDCAMCFWGESLVLGPNINAGMDAADNPRAVEAADKAESLADNGTELEQALIEALQSRYAQDPPDDRSPLDRAYADAMADVAKRFPDDPNAASLYAEALMDTMPWAYWEADGSPKPATETLLATLERVLESHPQHPLANHLYIHAVEKVHPEHGIAAADRLRDLVPGAGHLVHMPGHIYVRIGRYADAVRANEKAIDADQAYIAQCHAQGLYPVAYMPHNHHFLSVAASFIADENKAIDAAEHMRAHTDPQLMRAPGLTGTLQHYWTMPYYAAVRFGHWKPLLAATAPDEDLLYPTGVYHYARGLALVRTGNAEAAEDALSKLAYIAGDPELAVTRVMETNTMADLLGVAREELAGELALARGDTDRAIEHLKTAVALEDKLIYVEPPDWYVPTRHNLGAALLAAGRPAEAEAVYRKDLEIYPDNVWSLAGLEQSLSAQGRDDEAGKVGERRERMQARAASEPEIAQSRL